MPDDMGDRMKMFEQRYAGQKLLPNAPAVARLDGRSFSKFAKGLLRPYDQRLSDLMVDTMIFLVEESNATIGYTQSDEITLAYPTLYGNFFDGKMQKVVSSLASLCTAKFNALLSERIPEKAGYMALFDCRVWDLPDRQEAANAVLWREFDATKNSISMAAHHYFSHKSLQGLNGKQMQEKLFQEVGVNWNDYPNFFKRGTYARRVKKMKTLSDEELAKIPEKYRPVGPVERTVVERIEMPPFNRVENRVGVVFEGEEPCTACYYSLNTE